MPGTSKDSAGTLPARLTNGRVRLDARGNVFMARAIELDVKLQNLAKGTFIPSFLARA
jgi:hypothetical protein